MMPGFLKKIEDTLLFNGDGELIFYIPEKYFESKIATVTGEYIECLGIFDYDVFDKGGKHMGLKNFYFPTLIKCKPTTVEKIAEFKLTPTSEPVPYRFLHFSKGAEVICSTRIPMSVHNVENFIKLLKSANLPETIPYDKLYEYIMHNAALNGFSYKMSAQIFGIIVSELCRDPKDLTKPFRLTDMKNMTDYQFMNILTIPKYISPYTAITSENADESIANAITNKSHKDSPLEKVMMN